VGESSVSIDETMKSPKTFTLLSAYPNPFNPSTQVRFNVSSPSQVTTVQIVDISGRLVETLLNKTLSVGEHTLQWYAGNQPSGVYFIRLKFGSLTKTHKIVFMK
jgi:flagellar hook assembly protein FlgD